MEEKSFNELIESMEQGADILADKVVLVPKETTNQAIKEFADEVEVLIRGQEIQGREDNPFVEGSSAAVGNILIEFYEIKKKRGIK